MEHSNCDDSEIDIRIRDLVHWGRIINLANVESDDLVRYILSRDRVQRRCVKVGYVECDGYGLDIP